MAKTEFEAWWDYAHKTMPRLNESVKAYAYRLAEASWYASRSQEPHKRPIQGGWLEKDTLTGEVQENIFPRL